MKAGDIVQFDRKSTLLGIIEQIGEPGEEYPGASNLWVYFLPEVYSVRRLLDNCQKLDKLWAVG